ncbi:MAG: aspartate aminotransferase family protein, partial [Myxococcota bacterium]
MNIDFDHALPALTRLLEAHLKQEQAREVRPPRSPEDLSQNIDLDITVEGQGFDAMMAALGEVLDATPATASPRFFNQLFAGRDGAALMGEIAASVLNNSMYTYKVAGVHVLIEMLLVRRMGQLMGLDDPEGVFTPGGSLSNLSAMVVARNEAISQNGDEGVDGRTLRIYTSVDGHYSVPKAAALLGIGRNNVVKIPVDDRGRMLPAALEQAIKADKSAGFTPAMINATAGTTVLGAFDPIPAIADVAERQGVWLHIDGAYGGSMVFHPDFTEQMAGTDRADSITWDAHKMLGVPLTCSVVLVRQRGLLTKHFTEDADYLFQEDEDRLNPGTRSIQCGRRNDALKLWTAWKAHGDDGFGDRSVTLRDLTLHANARVEAHPDLTAVRAPESMNLCFTVRGVDPDHLCRVLNQEAKSMVGFAFVTGVKVVRVVFLNPTVTTEDVDTFFDAVIEVADRLRDTPA